MDFLIVVPFKFLLEVGDRVEVRFILREDQLKSAWSIVGVSSKVSWELLVSMVDSGFLGKFLRSSIMLA